MEKLADQRGLAGGRRSLEGLQLYDVMLHCEKDRGVFIFVQFCGERSSLEERRSLSQVDKNINTRSIYHIVARTRYDNKRHLH